MKKDVLKQFTTLRRSLEAEKERLVARLNSINETLGVAPGTDSAKKKKTMSPAARAKIAAAQTARWARVRAARKK